MITDHRDFLTEIKDYDLDIYRRVLPAESRLLDALDVIPWDSFEEDLVKFYCPNLGQPALSVILLLKLEYLKYAFHLSDRNVIERAETDLLFRWFLQVPVVYRMPCPTTLCRFRGRIGTEGFQAIFDRLVGVARDAGFVQDRLRLKDASHVYANIAVPTTISLLGQLRQKMLAAIEPIDAEIATGFQIQADQSRIDTEQESDEIRLQARLDLVCDIYAWMQGQSTPQAEWDRKIWDRFCDVRALAAKIVSDCLHPGQGDRTLSVVDSDARRGMHGEYYDGYMVDILMDADSQLITQVEVLPANGAEAMDAIDLIRGEQQAHGNQIEQLSIDGAGFNGPMLRELEDPDGLAIDVITPPRDFGGPSEIASTQFELTDDGEHLTCPAGAMSQKGYHDAKKPNRTQYDFSKGTCWGCPLRPQCCPEMKEKSRRGRRVYKNEYEEEYERARQKSKTKGYQEVRRRHPAIERKLNEVVRHGHGRYAIFWSRSKVKIQQLMTCATINIKRMIKLQRERCALIATI